MKKYRRPFSTMIGNLVAILTLISIAWFSHFNSDPSVPVIFLCMATICLVLFAKEPLLFEIHSDQLLVRRIFGIKIYSFSQIKQISLDEIPSWLGGRIPSIRLELFSGKKIQLMSFRRLRKTLHEDLLSAWRANETP